MKISGLKRLDENQIVEQKDEILLFANVRNEQLRLEFFLNYYRDLGVDRFFIVDNDSTDSSRDYLLHQNDVHLFWTDESFVENKCGLLWLDSLRNQFANENWCVTVDADELFVFPFCEHLDLKDLAGHLDVEASNALLCLMIDCYPKGPLAKAKYSPGTPFWDASPYFDSGPYFASEGGGQTGESIGLFGGPRYRVFYDGGTLGRGPRLKKMPFVKWGSNLKYTAVNHSVSGSKLSATTGIILHYKFLVNYAEFVKAEVERGQRQKKVDTYGRANDVMIQQPNLSLLCEKSLRYEDSLQLVKLGLSRVGKDFTHRAFRLLRKKMEETEVKVLHRSVRDFERTTFENQAVDFQDALRLWNLVK